MFFPSPPSSARPRAQCPHASSPRGRPVSHIARSTLTSEPFPWAADSMLAEGLPQRSAQPSEQATALRSLMNESVAELQSEQEALLAACCGAPAEAHAPPEAEHSLLLQATRFYASWLRLSSMAGSLMHLDPTPAVRTEARRWLVAVNTLEAEVTCSPAVLQAVQAACDALGAACKPQTAGHDSGEARHDSSSLQESLVAGQAVLQHLLREGYHPVDSSAFSVVLTAEEKASILQGLRCVAIPGSPVSCNSSDRPP